MQQKFGTMSKKIMRFDITEKDIEQLKKGTIISVKPLKFNVFPAKEKRKYILACFLMNLFEEDHIYHEFEVNEILQQSYDDFATVRRFLIDYGFMKRSDDCKSYWLNVQLSEFSRFR